MAVSRKTWLVLAAMAAAGVVAVILALPATPPDLRSPRAAEFRSEARIVYRSALTESCPPVKRWPRAKYLASQRQALAEFENNHAGPLAAQLQIARDDAALDLGCSNDSDPELAQIHVELARTNVTKGLAKLGKLAPEIGSGFFAPPASPRASAEFRRAARAAIGFSDPVCAVSTQADNDTVLADAQHALAAFRGDLQGTPRADDFDIAEADVLYADSITEWECSDPSDRPVAELSRDGLRDMQKAIAGMRKLL